MKDLTERFIDYVKINTRSDENSETCPSTKGQWDLARILEQECKALGLENVSLDENGYIMASLPSNTDKIVPDIGFIAHMDTALDASGENVSPQIIEKYDGNPIVLNEKENIILSPQMFPELLRYIGQSLITTDGTTLLGADDKAGIAVIMTAIEYLTKHPDIEHGNIRIAFTPDEEIGRGADKFDVKKFKADFAYTVDGGELGELECENFNAAKADVIITGINVHPGTAKDKMINANLVAMEFNAMLPIQERPEFTDNYEGFFHLLHMKGSVVECTMRYIIRDHDKIKFEKKKSLIPESVAYLNHKYGLEIAKAEITDQYFNMKEKIDEVPHIVDLAQEAMEACNIKVLKVPVRGGTDGSRLSFMGLPTPNLFTGGHNYHGIYEYIPIASMERSVDVILKIVNLTLQL